MPTKAVFFIGGCAGTSGPATARISCPSARTRAPLIEPISRGVFGTLTTSFGFVSGDTGAFVDNGSGVSNVVPFLVAQQLKHIFGLQTHYHLDHRNGLPTNRLLFMKGKVDSIYCPKLNGRSFQELVESDFSEESWPVSPKKLGVELAFKEFVSGEALPILGGVATFALKHPGGAVAFKFVVDGKTVVIATDNELGDDGQSQEYADFVSGADLLYADVQYRQPEYLGEVGIEGDTAFIRKGWGHSTPEMFRRVLSSCSTPPKLLIAGHHEPRRSDEDLERLEGEMQALFKAEKTQVRFARELDVYNL